ncbi:hypothetical protein [Parasitella parasitica]|nr:hypothetical protein [Parasitella parasitica]
MDTAAEILQDVGGALKTTTDRCPRIQGEPQNGGDLELPARPRSNSNRCLPVELAEEGPVSSPSGAINSKGHPQDQEGSDPLNNPGNSRVAEPILVAHGDSTKQILTPQTGHFVDLDLDRLGVIRRFQEAKLGKEATKYLQKAVVTSTHKQYEWLWRQWASAKKRSAPSLPNAQQETFDIAIINTHVRSWGKTEDISPYQRNYVAAAIRYRNTAILRYHI